MNKRFYAGIGSRETPPEIMLEMIRFASIMERSGFILRSGNASGADQAFAEGVILARAQIWLPWETFNDSFKLHRPFHDYRVISDEDEAAWLSVEEFHPNAKNLSDFGKKFMARNYRQMIGKDDEANSEFVVCWTREGMPVGGTSFALRVAKAINTPIINMHHYNSCRLVIDRLCDLGFL